MSPAPSRTTILVCGAIVLFIFAAYSHVVECGFLICDDTTHVTENPVVLNGLAWDSVKKAFTTPLVSLWIPLTWVSFMADVSVFGLSARAMHVENVLLHAVNAVLLFVLLKRATLRFWPSAAVVMLFGLHPINVESVAWITERKNVLCLFFGLLSLNLYASYAQRSSRAAYLGALALFGLALLAKPMLVPLPAGLLLLDIWPLKRLDWANWRRRALEKVPFLLVAIGASAMAMQASLGRTSAVTFDQLPLSARVSNALVSYATYLHQLVWPTDLCVIYPHPQVIEWLKAGISAIVLIGITLAAWRLRRQFPYVLVGWLWFLGMLAPMIGLVQVGTQARADRFTYAAQIGIFVAAVWLIADLWGARSRRFPTYISAVVGAGLMILTLRQVEYWTNGVTLFEHTIAVAHRNPLAHANAGLARAQLGDYESAVSHYKTSLGFAPTNPKLWNQLALTLIQLNRNAEAAEAARQAVAQAPGFTAARFNLATACERSGDDSNAIVEYRELAQREPAMVIAHLRLGMLLAKRGEIEAATQSVKEAARLRPNDATIADALRKLADSAAK
jgi:tetratricopeptide (TPR) repeat protein